MSTRSQQSIRTHWRLTLTIIVAGWSVVPLATAESSDSPVIVASLSVSTIQPKAILKSLREPPERPIPLLHRKPTDADDWNKFEEEYRPEPRDPSPIKRQIETAKYGLDTTVFAVDRFVKSIRDHADFEFDQGHMRRTRANSRGGFLDNPRVKLDLDMTHGTPYLGARVVIPFGK